MPNLHFKTIHLNFVINSIENPKINCLFTQFLGQFCIQNCPSSSKVFGGHYLSSRQGRVKKINLDIYYKAKGKYHFNNLDLFCACTVSIV